MSFQSFRMLVLAMCMAMACTALAQPATPQGPPEQPACNENCLTNPPCGIARKGGSLCILSSCSSCLPEVWGSTQNRCVILIIEGARTGLFYNI